MTAAYLCLLALFGLVIGSFLNVVIVRMPDQQSIVSPPSKCPQCGNPIASRDNIPVISWLLLRGKCRHCAKPIPIGYPLVEAGNALLWVAAGVRFGVHPIVVPYLLLFSVLLAQSVIDMELYILLDRITFPALLVSLPLLGGIAFTRHDPRTAIVGALIGSVGYFLFLGIPAVIYPKGMGLGDVKLALLMGLYLGFLHWALPLFAVIIACLIGIVVGGVLYFARGRESKQFPFGPWLAAGCVLAILFNSAILGPYGFHAS